MSLPSNTFPSYSVIGTREDLSDEIYRIDPTETPFITGVDKAKATQTNHEWQTQALAAASTSNAQVEGDDATRDAVTPTVRLGNRCQISRKVPAVTGTVRAINNAGRGDELEYEEMLKGLELRRDMESILVGSNQAKVTAAAATAPKLASVLSWIKTNTDKATTGTVGVDPSAADGTGTRTDGTQRAFTETSLKNVLNLIWTNGGKPDTIMVGAFNKQQFSTFQGRGSVLQDATDKRVTAVVNVYDSDFGTLKVVPNRFMRSRDALVLQMDMWAVAYLRKFESTNLAKTGDSDARMLVSEYTLEARNEKSSGGVFDLTTS
jgi:hypothetical protein